MKWFVYIILSLVLPGITGCGGDQVVRLGPLDWADLQFIVEARPTPIRAGMTEFIVIASREKVKPGTDIVVSLRIDEKVEWKQAIQDGYTGVFRRAIRVNNPLADVLEVHVRKIRNAQESNENETILRFPLSQKQG